MTSLDELDDLWPPPDPAVLEREPRKCRRHDFRFESRQTFDGSVDAEWKCARCGKVQDLVASRRGRNNRSRGNAMEREVAAKLGLRRVGQFGGPDDIRGLAFAGQVKSGTAFPEKLWRWLRAVPANSGETAILVITDAPGPGHQRRALVILDLEDWRNLHGPAAVRGGE